MYDIKNALTEKSLQLSENIHRPYKMMPPELLHTLGSGLIMYMFKSLQDQMGGGKDRGLIDQEHIQISNLIKRQSERDFPSLVGKSARNSAEFYDYSGSGPFELWNVYQNFMFLIVKCVLANS